MTSCNTGYVLVNGACYACSANAGYAACTISQAYALTCSTGYVLVSGYCH